jgi:small GTP-binding protein
MQVLEFEKKMLLVGDAAVGKTSLVRRFVIDKFDDKYIITVGTKTSRKVLELIYEREGVTIYLMLGVWDIIGQKELERTHQMHFRGAESYMLTLDGTRRDTFDSLKHWADSVHAVCGPIPGVLACNKVDLRSQFQVSDQELASMAKQLGLTLFFTSAKTGEKVEAAFRLIGDSLCKPILRKYAGAGAEASASSASGKKGGTDGR